MSASHATTYSAHPTASPEAELNAIVAIYRRALERCEENTEKEGGPATAPKDARKDKDAGTQPHCT